VECTGGWIERQRSGWASTIGPVTQPSPSTSPRTSLSAVLAVTILASFGTGSLWNGLPFIAEHDYHFDKVKNLALLTFLGVIYVGGALSAGPATRLVERRLSARGVLVWALGVQAVLALGPWFVDDEWIVWVVMGASSLLASFFWPIVESYITAGLLARQMLRGVGRFCIAWSLAVPVGVAVTGPLIASGWAPSFFLAAALCHVFTLGLFARLPARPAHAAHDHPQQPNAARLARYTKLLAASRWSMLASYALLFLLAPLLPHITKHTLGLSTAWATPAASVMDGVRDATFAALSVLTFWCGRASPLLAAVILLPVGFAMVLFGQTLTIVLAGEVIFGMVGGLVYYAALYYALAVKNAAVEAGGAHEALIGCGFALGPLCGLVGLGLTRVTGGYVEGMLLGAAPLVALCAWGGAWPLIRLLRPAPPRP